MRFNNLQILRLLTATAVVLVHLGSRGHTHFGVEGGPVPWLLLPWLATALVPLFFALSGFVLTLTLQRTSPGRYLALRAVRLYPGFWLALGLVMVVHALGLWPSASLHVANPAPNLQTVALFAKGREHSGQYPLMVEWTLIYEVFLSVALLGLHAVAGSRRLPWVAGAWLVVLVVRSVFWPGYGSQMMPSWKSIWASAYLAPFLLGVLAFHAREHGKKWRWAALAVVVVSTLMCTDGTALSRTEWVWWVRGLGAAMTVWFLVQIPDASPRSPLVVAGAFSYGLYLVHVPVILLAMGAMRSLGIGYGTWTGLFMAGFAALALGLAYGRLEAWLHGQLKALVARSRRRAELPATTEPVTVRRTQGETPVGDLQPARLGYDASGEAG